MTALLVVLWLLLAAVGYATAQCVRLHLELLRVRAKLTAAEAWKRDREELDEGRDRIIRALVMQTIREPEAPVHITPSVAWFVSGRGETCVVASAGGRVVGLSFSPHGWETRRH